MMFGMVVCFEGVFGGFICLGGSVGAHSGDLWVCCYRTYRDTSISFIFETNGECLQPRGLRDLGNSYIHTSVR